MKHAIYTVLIALSLTSCDITKQSAKSKTESATTEESETKTIRLGDTVYYQVPAVKLKDTTIYTYNRQGSSLKIVYDKSGQVSDVDCVTSAIELYEKKRIESELSTKDKAKEKTEQLNTDWILYAFITIGVVLIVALILLYFYIRKNTAIINSISGRL